MLRQFNTVKRHQRLCQLIATCAFGMLVPAHLFSEPDIDPNLRALLDRILSVKVEMSADLLFTAVDSGKIPNAASIDYLRRLFDRATEARRPYPMMPVPRLERPNQATVFSEVLSGLNLDTMSIRLRAIKRIAQRDAAAARELAVYLENTPPPVAIGCDEIEIPVPRDLYSTLYELSRDHFASIAVQASTPQEAVGLLEVLPKLSSDEKGPVVTALLRSLGCSKCSDRVFTTTELTLGLGRNIENAINRQIVPPSLETALAQAYLLYLDRQLQRERCSDVGTTDKDDFMPLAQRLAAKYHLVSPDLSNWTASYSSTVPKQASIDLKATHGLLVIASKLKQSASPELRASFESAVDAYMAPPLDKDASTWDIFLRCGTLIQIAIMLGEPDFVRRPIDEVVRIIENPSGLKALDPRAWVLIVRMLLNLTRHPDSEVEVLVRTRLLQSSDVELHAYTSIDSLVGGMIHQYQEDPLRMPPGLLAPQ